MVSETPACRASLLAGSSRRSNANTTSRRWAAVNSDRLPIDSSFPVRTIQLYPKEVCVSKIIAADWAIGERGF
jgi:hypothetical protein